MTIKPCIFCRPRPEEVILENCKAYAKYDKYPVSQGHLLIIPKRHFRSVIEATEEELSALWNLLTMARSYLDEKFTPDGYNIGINDGTAAGQTVMHLHIHLIPRYVGDIPDPRGGVRGVIPDKQHY